MNELTLPEYFERIYACAQNPLISIGVNRSINIPSKSVKLMNLTYHLKGVHKQETDVFFELGKEFITHLNSLSHQLVERKKHKPKPYQLMGWGGQIAYAWYLDLRLFQTQVRILTDDPFRDLKNDRFDLLFYNSHSFYADVKTAPNKMGKVTIYKSGIFNKQNKHPDYLIILECLRETMTLYRTRGYINFDELFNKYDKFYDINRSRWRIPLDVGFNSYKEFETEKLNL